jgi:hypothetical protein
MLNSAATSLLRARVAGFSLGLALLAGPAVADSISPTTFSATIGVGGVASVNKTVTVSAGLPTTAQVDIFFLSDTTGSMGPVISQVQTQIGGAGGIMANTAGFGNVQWGAGNYKDSVAQGDAYISQINQTMTSTQSSVQTAVNGWSAFGGGDTPESGYNGLVDAATNGGFRAGSQKFVVWFSDATSKDGAVAGSPYTPEATAISTLQGQNIHVIAVDSGAMNADGQAQAVATATGGSYTLLGSNNVSTIIGNALISALASYSSVTLDLSEVPAGLLASLSPTDITGSFTREDEHTFQFLLSFTGLIPGVYDFNVYGTVDGGRVATEPEHIVVTGGEVPLPGSAALMASALIGFGGVLRRHKRKKAA